MCERPTHDAGYLSPGIHVYLVRQEADRDVVRKWLLVMKMLTHHKEVMQCERLGLGPQVRVVREARQTELLPLFGQRRGDLGSAARAHQEHNLVVAVVLGEGPLGKRNKLIHKTCRN